MIHTRSKMAEMAPRKPFPVSPTRISIRFANAKIPDAEHPGFPLIDFGVLRFPPR